MIQTKTIMMMLILCFYMGSTSAQTDAQKEVRATVETYFKGYKAGSAEILKKVFHENFHLTWVDPWKGNSLQQVDRAGMFEFFGPDWSKLKIKSEIIETKVQNRSAYCEAKVTLEGIVIWTDHINLLKLADDQWWIVSKTSEGKLIR